MKQQLIISILILTNLTFIQGQNYNIEWSEFTDIPSKSMFGGIVKNTDGFSLFYNKNETYYSDNYNSNLELLKEVEFEAPYNSKHTNFRFLRFIKTKDSKNFALYSEKSKDRKNWTLYASLIKDGKTEKGKEIFSIQKENSKYLNLSNEVRYSTRPDKSEVMYTFLNIVRESSKKWHYEIVVSVFDDKMNLKWSKIHKIEKVDDSGQYLVQSKIDSYGKVHILLRKISRSTLKRYKMEEKELSLYTVYSINQIDVKQHDIMFEDKQYPSSINLELHNNQRNKIVVNGAYSNNPRDENISGTFFIEVDTKTEEAIYKLKVFKEEIIIGSYTRLLSSFTTTNNNYAIAFEDIDIITSGSGSSQTARTVKGNIYLLFFNKNGEYLKTLQINKKGERISSTPIIRLENKTYIIYNDVTSKKIKLVIIDDETMSIQKEEVLDPSEKTTIIKAQKPIWAFPVNGSIMFYQDNHNKYVVGKLIKE